jgi:4-amino-4-deoxy-L-arabinose transferase-like glycosyltransferase
MRLTRPEPPKDGPIGRLVFGSLAVLWAGLVLLAYYYTHKPIQPEQAAALARLAKALVAWVGTLVLAFWLGGIIRRFIPPMRGGAFTALRIGLGLGVIGLLVLALGMAHAYYPLMAWALLLPGMLLGARGFLQQVRRWRPRLPQSGFDRFLASFVALFIGLAFLRALAPPTAWDALVYHLTGPKLYIEAHALVHNLDLPYLGFPAWGSMLFTWGMLLAGSAAAKLLHFSFMLLTLWITADMARRFAPGRAWLSVALLAAVPSLMMIAGWAYVEWMTMFAAVGAFWCLFHAYFARVERGPGDPEANPALADASASEPNLARAERGAVALSGILAGLGFSAKYTLVGLVAGLALLAFLRRRAWKDLFTFGAAFCLIAAPYLLKNWALTGNPLYPFFFPGIYWDAHRQFWYSRPGTGLSMGQVLLAPWEATVWGVEGGAYEGHPSYGASIGPLLLILLPLAGLYLRRARQGAAAVLTKMLILCGIVALQWAVMLAFSALLVQSRLLFVIFPFLGLLAALGLEGLGEFSGPQFRADFVLRAFIVLSLSLTALGGALSFIAGSPLPAILGLQSRDDYLLARLGGYYLAMEGVNDLPDGSRITFLWEPRSYYCPESVICEPDALLDRWWHLRQHGLRPESIAAAWRDAGTTHVLVNWSGADAVREAGFDPLDSSDWAALGRLVDDELVEVADWAGGYSLYQLK